MPSEFDLCRYIRHIQMKYAYRNRELSTFSTSDLFIILMQFPIGLLEDLTRGKRGEPAESELGAMFAWSCTTAMSLEQDLWYTEKLCNNIVEQMCLQHPASHCHYCGSDQTPCECRKEKINERQQLTDADPVQLGWTIRDWQRHLHARYGKNNEELGLQGVLVRICAEITEAQGAIMLHLPRGDDYDEIAKYAGGEFADILAWIIAFAALVNVDLQDVIEDRYVGECRRCDCFPCKCPHPATLPNGSRSESKYFGQ